MHIVCSALRNGPFVQLDPGYALVAKDFGLGPGVPFKKENAFFPINRNINDAFPGGYKSLIDFCDAINAHAAVLGHQSVTVSIRGHQDCGLLPPGLEGVIDGDYSISIQLGEGQCHWSIYGDLDALKVDAIDGYIITIRDAQPTTGKEPRDSWDREVVIHARNLSGMGSEDIHGFFNGNVHTVETLDLAALMGYQMLGTTKLVTGEEVYFTVDCLRQKKEAGFGFNTRRPYFM